MSGELLEHRDSANKPHRHACSLPQLNPACLPSVNQVSEHFPDDSASGAGGSGGDARTASVPGSGQAKQHPDVMQDPYSGGDPSQKQGGGSE